MNELIAGEELKRKTERKKDEEKSEKEESSLGARSTGKAVRGQWALRSGRVKPQQARRSTQRWIRVEL